MKEFIAKYQKAIVGTGAVAVLVVCWLQQKELNQLRAEHKIDVVVGGDIQKAQVIDSITAVADSLRDELFIERVDAGRHEITREEILGKYPKIAKEYDEFYSHQTE